MKSESLNLLEPSGPHRTCYGTAVPFNIFTCLHSVIRLYYLIVIHDSVQAEGWTGHQLNVSQNHY